MNVVDLFAKERNIQNIFVKKVLDTIVFLMVSILEPFYEALHLIRRILNKDYYTIILYCHVITTIVKLMIVKVNSGCNILQENYVFYLVLYF